jgi:hypothetical protein
MEEGRVPLQPSGSVEKKALIGKNKSYKNKQGIIELLTYALARGHFLKK